MAKTASVESPAPRARELNRLQKWLCLVAWLAAFGLVELLAWWVVPSFEAMFKDLGQKLPSQTVLVLSSAGFLRSPPGVLAALLLVAGSVAGCWRASRSRRFWVFLGSLTLVALAWTAFTVPELLVTLSNIIERIE
jgi:type II secretory pathway component PulF